MAWRRTWRSGTCPMRPSSPGVSGSRFDLRGLGRSQMTPDGYSPQNLAKGTCPALLDHLGIARAHILAQLRWRRSHSTSPAGEPRRCRASPPCRHPCRSGAQAARQPRLGQSRQRCRRCLTIMASRWTPRPFLRLPSALTEVAHLQLQNRPSSGILDLLGPMMSKHGKRTAAQWVKLMDQTNAEVAADGRRRADARFAAQAADAHPGGMVTIRRRA